MKDCRTCKFDKEAAICGQGHYRMVKTTSDFRAEITFLFDCHAWVEKECVCKNSAFQGMPKGQFYMVCKTCGRKIE